MSIVSSATPASAVWAGIAAKGPGWGDGTHLTETARAAGGTSVIATDASVVARFVDAETAGQWLADVAGRWRDALAGALVLAPDTTTAQAAEAALAAHLAAADAGEIVIDPTLAPPSAVASWGSLSNDPAVDAPTRLAARREPQTQASSRTAGQHQAENHDDLQPGSVLSHTYEIERRLGRGGMGTVYVARHVELRSQHAIKVISPEHARDEQVIALFRKEAESLRSVRHDAVVAHEGTIRDEFGRLYLVMEFADGPTLAEVLRNGPLDPDEVETLARRVGGGLDAAHDKGIIHRDISPDNIVLVDGRVAEAKIIDFGIARNLAAGGETVIGSAFAGKYTYAAPEQLGMFGGRVDRRADVYSFGLSLAAALGHPIDMGGPPAEAMKRRERVPDLDHLPASWRGRLTRMLQPDPADRPDRLADVATAPPPTLSAPDPSLRPDHATRQIAPSAPTATDRPHRPWRTGALLALGLVALAGIGWLFRDQLPGLSQHGSAETETGSAAGPSDHAPNRRDDMVSGEPGVTRRPDANGSAVQATHRVDRAVIRERVQAAIAPPQCAQVTTQLVDAASGWSVRLSGFVPDAAAGERIRQNIGSLPEVNTVHGSLDVRPPPFCTLLAAAGPTDGSAAPQLTLNHADGLYHNGDLITLRVTARGDGPRHLHISYLDAEGTVLHLLPSEAYPDNKLRPGETIRLGDPAHDTGGVQYRAAAPYGDNLLIAVSSTQALFVTPRAAQETVQTYARALQDALARVRGNGGTADVATRFLRTER